MYMRKIWTLNIFDRSFILIMTRASNNQVTGNLVKSGGGVVSELIINLLGSFMQWSVPGITFNIDVSSFPYQHLHHSDVAVPAVT